ncbi:type Z 30S ribosomal protein S14 [Candidatus Microgenomates bacterium]|nr:MAG: type Z 30S ribosomal protein S14 [Candidatus Microgenomates bacterium]
MAKTSSIVRNNSKLKFKNRYRNRCALCGRSRGYMRKFGICRLDFRRLAHKGELPGVVKASW